MVSQKDVVGFWEKKLSAFGIRKNSKESDAVERSLRGEAPQILGKDEVASSNLASSSKRTPIPLGIGVLFLFIDKTDQRLKKVKIR